MSTTPYMSITLPVVSSTPGPDWATDLNVALTTVDSHNHAAGQGLPVPTAGISINADLPLNLFNLITARTLRMSSLPSNPALASDLGCLSNVNGNLCFNNNSGTTVQITAGAALNAASIGGIGGDYSTSTASMFYTSASKTFTLWQNTNVPAKLDLGDIILRNISTPTNAVTLLAPSGLAASYQLTLGNALPGGLSHVAIDASGNLSYTNSLVSLTLSGAFSGTSGAFSTTLSIGSLASDLVPDANNTRALGSSSNKFTKLYLGTNIGTSTPDANAQYADSIIKAWATVSGATPTINGSMNIATASFSSTGNCDYTFRRAMANINYVVVAISGSAGTNFSFNVTNRTTAGFTLQITISSTGALSSAAHNFMVIGQQ